MNIFLDTADSAAIQKYAAMEIVSGVTTNPTHLKNAAQEPLGVIHTLCAMIDRGTIHVEVTESDPDKVYQEARRIAAINPRVVVKIPCAPELYRTVAQLVNEGIPINITLVFSLPQALFMAKLNVAYISPFLGRLKEHGGNSTQLIHDLCTMKDYYGFSSEIMAASIRTPEDFDEALNAGSDNATISPTLLETLVEQKLTRDGIARFSADWAKLGQPLFPS